MAAEDSARDVQRQVQQPASDAPFGESPTIDPLVVFEDEQRIQSTRFQVGNTFALKHGLRSRRVLAGEMPDQSEALAAMPERISAIVEGLGGLDELSPLKLGEVRRHAKLELVEQYCWAQIETQGVTTAKGRTRACVSLWLQVHDRLAKSAQMLGLERRAKKVPTPQELLS